MRMISHNEEETRKIAIGLAKRLRGGEVVLLYGDLGAGKTVFVKGLAKALGIKETIKSPTFNIMKIYNTKAQKHHPSPRLRMASKSIKTLCHIDAYRLKSYDDLLDIGADEYFGKENAVSVIEWAERAEGAEKFGNKIIKIKIKYGKKENERLICVK